MCSSDLAGTKASAPFPHERPSAARYERRIFTHTGRVFTGSDQGRRHYRPCTVKASCRTRERDFLSVAGRHYTAQSRCDRKRGKQCHDRLLAALPCVHRQLHPYVRRRAVARGVCRHHAKTGARFLRRKLNLLTWKKMVLC